MFVAVAKPKSITECVTLSERFDLCTPTGGIETQTVVFISIDFLGWYVEWKKTQNKIIVFSETVFDLRYRRCVIMITIRMPRYVYTLDVHKEEFRDKKNK